MEIRLTPEQETELLSLAASAGKTADALAAEALGNFVATFSQFVAAVKVGEADLDRGDSFTQAEIDGQIRQLIAG